MSDVVVARIVRAESSSDLSEGLEDADVDVLRAVGMAGRLHGVAAHLLRAAGEHDRSAARQAVDALREWLARKFPLLERDMVLVAAVAAVALWLEPACGGCRGLGFHVIPDTTTLSDSACAECRGSGKASVDLPQKARPAMDLASAYVSEEVEKFCRSVGRRLARIHSGVERGYALRPGAHTQVIGPGAVRVLPKPRAA